VVHPFLVPTRRPDARSPTGQPEWLHGDLYQTDLGEWYLREAIKHTVANDGHPAVVENLRWRTVERDARELLKRYREEPPEPG
jgi:hypothetical protein